MLVVLMLRKKLCLQAKLERFQNLQYRDCTICVNGFWRENVSEKNFKRVAREVICGETRESRLAEYCSNSKVKRQRVYTRKEKVVSKARESNMSCMGYSGGEARKIIMTPYVSLMARNMLLTVLAATWRDRSEKDESGFSFCLLHAAQHLQYRRQSTAKNQLAHNVDSALVRKPWCLCSHVHMLKP